MLERSGDGQDMKTQAKDSQQGGLYQMEPEPGTMESDTLGPDLTYTSQAPGDERLCFTNGRFAGYDRPELATLVSNTEKVATWQVASGGRIGMVIGEDALVGDVAHTLLLRGLVSADSALRGAVHGTAPPPVSK